MILLFGKILTFPQKVRRSRIRHIFITHDLLDNIKHSRLNHVILCNIFTLYKSDIKNSIEVFMEKWFNSSLSHSEDRRFEPGWKHSLFLYFWWGWILWCI
jgi:hypothetical protein